MVDVIHIRDDFIGPLGTRLHGNAPTIGRPPAVWDERYGDEYAWRYVDGGGIQMPVWEPGGSNNYAEMYFEVENPELYVVGDLTIVLDLPPIPTSYEGYWSSRITVSAWFIETIVEGLIGNEGLYKVYLGYGDYVYVAPGLRTIRRRGELGNDGDAYTTETWVDGAYAHRQDRPREREDTPFVSVGGGGMGEGQAPTIKMMDVQWGPKTEPPLFWTDLRGSLQSNAFGGFVGTGG